MPADPRPLRLSRRTLAALALLLSCGCSGLRSNVSSDYAVSAALAEPPPVWADAATLRVVTWNVKDMVLFSDHRAERMERIGVLLAEQRPDVVCLQEGFVRGDVERIASALADIGIVHVQDYPSMAVGSGLWILSRYPIRESYFHQFTRNGHWWQLTQGDWWSGKGVALARLELPDGRLLDVYDTHFVASYGSGAASHDDDRLTQAEELGEFVLGATPRSIPALLMGDFNDGPGEPAYQAVVERVDANVLCNSDWRLDHIFGVRASGPYRARPVGERVPLVGGVTVGGKSHALSDHTGYLVEVEIVPLAP